MNQPRQPFLHDLAILVAAPSQVFGREDGAIGRADGPVGVEGLWHADLRVLAGLVLTVDGRSPEHIATRSLATDENGDGLLFTFLLRELADAGPAHRSTPVRLDVERRLAPGRLTETLTVTSWLDQPVTLRLASALVRDLAPMPEVRGGSDGPPLSAGPDPLTWGNDEVTAQLSAPDAGLGSAPATLELTWDLSLSPKGSTTVTWTLVVTDQGSVVGPAGRPALDAARIAQELAERTTDPRRGTDHRLRPWLERSLADLNGLRMTTIDNPDDVFFAAGSPWYLTLFGRDSLWTARMLLPVDAAYAMGTLRVLARRAGTSVDLDSAEAPGKILHELRRAAVAHGDIALPPLYYGTIDATPLWVCTLYDAWRSGVSDEEVETLLPTLEGALRWVVEDGDADGDGFLEYLDVSGHGLANQGWKDSADSVRFADGTIATGPVALCEVQAYAYEAACTRGGPAGRLRPARRGTVPGMGGGAEGAVPGGVLVRRERGPVPRPGPGRRQAACRHVDQQHRPPAGHRSARPGRGAGRRPAPRRARIWTPGSACARCRRRTVATPRSATTADRCGRTTPRSPFSDCTAPACRAYADGCSRACSGRPWPSLRLPELWSGEGAGPLPGRLSPPGLVGRGGRRGRHRARRLLEVILQGSELGDGEERGVSGSAQLEIRGSRRRRSTRSTRSALPLSSQAPRPETVTRPSPEERSEVSQRKALRRRDSDVVLPWGGGGGNRTRVLGRRTRTSPGAAG